MNKLQELFEEFKSVYTGRGSRLLDSFLPLLVFLITNPLIGLNYALWGALVLSGIFTLHRILKRESWVYAFGGLSGVLLAALFVILIGSEAGFFLPGLISGAVTTVMCVVSIILKRPLAAWSSFITRRWPLDWYWHPKILPAYNEVTMLWAVAFAGRMLMEFWLYQQAAIGALGITRLLLGWPFIIILLVISYLYGLWRLSKLDGPSVEEFKMGIKPPWEGQQRGF